jgi:hypothetical protein
LGLRGQKVDGLYPLYVDNRQKRFTNQHLSIGAMGDSFYECATVQRATCNAQHATRNTQRSRSAILGGLFHECIAKLCTASEPSMFY